MENNCQYEFESALQEFGAFHHLCTPGEEQPVIFSAPQEYEFAMNLVAMCAYDCPDVRIITFEWMSTHFHSIVAGRLEACRGFFSLLKKRLIRYFSSIGKVVDLSRFEPKYIPIPTLEALRNQIAYTNRNGYLACPDCTPFSYRYGANQYYYTPMMKEMSSGTFGKLTARQKAAMMHTHSLDYPADWRMAGPFVHPSEYCDIELGERMFRDANHYFNKLSKDVESYKDIASAVGDRIYYTDDELNSILFKLCHEMFGDTKSWLLPKDNKIALARKLHYEYNADNKKIARLLRIPDSVINEIFPPRPKR